MASDFSVAWQCLSKRTIVFFIAEQTPCPYPTRSHPAQLWHRCTEWSTVLVSTKPLITEENWPGRGLNLGLPNNTPALYPLLHKLMLKNILDNLKKLSGHPACVQQNQGDQIRLILPLGRLFTLGSFLLTDTMLRVGCGVETLIVRTWAFNLLLLSFM
jgi:hypothetical protein